MKAHPSSQHDTANKKTLLGDVVTHGIQSTPQYRFIKLEFEGTNYLTFAEFTAGSDPLTVVTQLNEYGATGQWSAEATVDQDTGTCFSAATGTGTVGWIVYDTGQTRNLFSQVTLDNHNRCGYGPITKIKVPSLGIQIV